MTDVYNLREKLEGDWVRKERTFKVMKFTEEETVVMCKETGEEENAFI